MEIDICFLWWLLYMDIWYMYMGIYMLEKCNIIKNRIDVGALPKWAGFHMVSSLLWMPLGNVSRKLSCARIASKCRSLKLAAVWPTLWYSSHNFKVTSNRVFLHIVIECVGFGALNPRSLLEVLTGVVLPQVVFVGLETQLTSSICLPNHPNTQPTYFKSLC